MKWSAPSWLGLKHTVSVNTNSVRFFFKEVLQDVATVTKGNGTSVRRRAKSAAKERAAAVKEPKGMPAHNGAAAARLDREMNVETIRLRAYELFLARGATHGNDLADWLNAERELLGACTT